MSKQLISDSIYDDGSIIIPMADVSHIEYLQKPVYKAENGINKPTGKFVSNGIMIITKHTKWDMEADTWSNAAFVSEEKKQGFIKAWCYYRYELEGLIIKN